MKILDGKKVANIESLKLKNIVSLLPKKPSLAIIQVGNLEESNKYINNKIFSNQKNKHLPPHYYYTNLEHGSHLINNYPLQVHV